MEIVPFVYNRIRVPTFNICLSAMLIVPYLSEPGWELFCDKACIQGLSNICTVTALFLYYYNLCRLIVSRTALIYYFWGPTQVPI